MENNDVAYLPSSIFFISDKGRVVVVVKSKQIKEASMIAYCSYKWKNIIISSNVLMLYLSYPSVEVLAFCAVFCLGSNPASSQSGLRLNEKRDSSRNSHLI